MATQGKSARVKGQKMSTNDIDDTNLIGMTFGDLTVIKKTVNHPKSRHKQFLCLCKCGNTKVVIKSYLINNIAKTCGCRYGRYIHGMKDTRFYHIWCNMFNRCNNSNNTYYHRYGGRGIKVCDKWKNFMVFKEDMYKSYIDHCKLYTEKNTTIDRIDNDLGYSKENCRWATFKIQGNNRHNANKQGINNGRSKLTENKVKEIRYKYNGEWGQITSLANDYNVSTSVINDIVKNKSWVHV